MRCLQLSHAITTFQSRGGVQTETAAKLFGWDAVHATVPRNYDFSKSRWCANAKWRLPEYCPIEPYLSKGYAVAGGHALMAVGTARASRTHWVRSVVFGQIRYERITRRRSVDGTCVPDARGAFSYFRSRDIMR